MSTTQTALTAPKTSEEKGLTVYVPFGSSDELKLSVAMVLSYIAVPTKTGKMPSEKDCIRFIAMCKARRLNPFEGDAFLIGFDSRDAPGGAKWNLITAHQAFLKRAERHPQFDGMDSGIIVQRGDALVELEGDFYLQGDEILGGWATIYFKSRSHSMKKRLRLARFQKQFGVWQEDPAGMICKCAEADALRSSFPTMLGGLYTNEEMTLEEAPKMKEPLFGGRNTLPEPIPVEAIGNSKSAVEQVIELCAKDGLQERSLIDWLGTIGMADEKATKVSELSDESLDALLSDWENFSNKLKAELNKTTKK